MLVLVSVYSFLIEPDDKQWLVNYYLDMMILWPSDDKLLNDQAS